MDAAIPERRPATEQISGLIERVTFHNDESGFCVLRVKITGQRDDVTVVGSLPSVTAGEWLAAEGWWVRDKEHGLQFKATTLKTVPPTTAEGIERYLGSGLVKGIGPILAKKLVGHFGAEVLVVIESRPSELQSVDGIGPKRRERIAHAWQEAKQIREIMLFLHSHGVSTSRAVRIFKAYGEQAIEKVRSNPYTLAKDIYGIGFATADQIAQKVGIPKDSINRAKAGIDHTLLEATSDGHCALPLGKAEALGGETTGSAGSHGRAGAFADAHKRTSVAGGDRRRIPDFYAASQASRARHRRKDQGAGRNDDSLPPDRFREGCRMVRKANGQDTRPQPARGAENNSRQSGRDHHRGAGRGQDDACELHPDHPASQRCEVPAVRSDRTSGKAARRHHGVEAKTIHRLLEVDPRTGRFNKDESNPSPATFWSWTRPRWLTCF